MKRIAIGASLILTMVSLAWPQERANSAKGRPASERARERIVYEVRHELLLLPYYGVFDHLVYRVNGYDVTLIGQVTRPSLKNDAERAVKEIEGVENVDNQIEVLPPSTQDDQIRVALYRAIYGHQALTRYAFQSIAPVRIVVKNGRVTLEGVVATEADKNLINIQARGVPGTFEVTNNLRVEGGGE